MYTSKLSESRGFSIAMRVAMVAIVAGAVTYAFGSAPGLVVVVVGLAIGFAAELRPDREESHPLREAANAPHPHGGAPGERHVLVVANAALAGDELAHTLGTGRVDILAPLLPSATHRAFSDVDRERADAQRRLAESLRWAVEHGIDARGEVGDADALTGIEDELRDFGADEVIVVSRSAANGRAETRELARLRADLDVPVHEIAV